MLSWMFSHSSTIITVGRAASKELVGPLLGTAKPINTAQDMETWHETDPQHSTGTVSDPRCTPQHSTPHVYSQFAEPLFGQSMNCEPNKHTHSQTGKAQSFPPAAVPSNSGWSRFDISSSSHCWWARSYAAKSLAWPGWKADRRLGRNEEFLHMHTWLMYKVWSLPAFLAEALARRKAVLADGPFD